MSKLLVFCLVAFSYACLCYALEAEEEIHPGTEDLPIDAPLIKAIKHYATHAYNKQSNDAKIYVLKKVFAAQRVVLPDDVYNVDVAFAPTNCLQNEDKKKLCIVEPNGKEKKVRVTVVLKDNKEVQEITFD